MAFGRRNAVRYACSPSTATQRGRSIATLASSCIAPSRSSAALSSLAAAVSRPHQVRDAYAEFRQRVLLGGLEDGLGEQPGSGRLPEPVPRAGEVQAEVARARPGISDPAEDQPEIRAHQIGECPLHAVRNLRARRRSTPYGRGRLHSRQASKDLQNPCLFDLGSGRAGAAPPRLSGWRDPMLSNHGRCGAEDQEQLGGAPRRRPSIGYGPPVALAWHTTGRRRVGVSYHADQKGG